MDDYTKVRESRPCNKPYRLCELEVGRPDMYNNRVEEIIYLRRNYAIYRSTKAMNVQFSDVENEEDRQRRRLTEIVPEVCELRYLTHNMRTSWRFPFKRRYRSSLYEHNMAEAIILVIDNEKNKAAALGKKSRKRLGTWQYSVYQTIK
jgi:hypothetical protein